MDQRSIVLLDVTLISTPREVYEEPEEEGAERKLIGWEADMDYMSCADPASWEAAKGYFDALARRLEYADASEEAAKAAYERALPPPPPEPPHPAPRKFSVKSVAAKIRELGYTAQVREALMSVNGYEMYVGANYLKEDDQDFRDMKALVQRVTGLDDDAIEAILEECIWEA